MDAILRFLLEKASFLYNQYGFRFVDSLVAPSFGSDACLILESKDLRLRFVSDRGQLFLDFQGKQSKKSDWYSIDLIYQSIAGRPQESAVLSDFYVAFLKDNLDGVVNAFSRQHIKETEARLKTLKKDRAKRMFG